MKLPLSVFAAAACSVLAPIAASTAFAGACASRDEFARHLSANYSEESQSIGVATDGSLFEIFASDTGTWSLLITNGKKISCIIAAGDTWVTRPALGPEAKLER